MMAVICNRIQSSLVVVLILMLTLQGLSKGALGLPCTQVYLKGNRRLLNRFSGRLLCVPLASRYPSSSTLNQPEPDCAQVD